MRSHPAAARLLLLLLALTALAGFARSSDLPAAPDPSAPAWKTELVRKSSSSTAAWSFEPNQALVAAGSAVATVGDLDGDGYSDAVVGAPSYASGLGAVYVLRGSATGWPAAPSQVVYGAGGSFGAAVSSAGDVNGDGFFDLIVGAPDGSGLDGQAFVYLGSPSGLITPAAWSVNYISPPLVISQFGTAVSTAGDVNGDGYDDVVVGVPGYDQTQGAALLYRGNATGVDQNASWVYVAPSVGRAVSGAGDINGDGYADVIVGLPNWNGGSGAAFIFHGSASGLSLAPLSQIHGDQFNGTLGYAVAGAGDVNGDGYSDVVVGSPSYDGFTLVDAGRAAIYPGGPGGVVSTQIWEEYGIVAGARFGEVVATAGDVDGDGLADIAVGAPDYSQGLSERGYAVVVQGSRYSLFVRWYREGTAAFERFGASLAAGGDVDGDGFGDLLVGAPGHGNVEAGEGRADVYRGAADAPSTQIAWEQAGGQDATFWGWVVSSAGDVNGDGYDDLLATGPWLDVFGTDDGGVYIYFGSPWGPGAYGWWAAAGEMAAVNFAVSAACAGDVNGDGYDDVIVGSPDLGGVGRAYIWYGGPGGPAFGPADVTLDGPSAGARFGASVASAGDIDGDGFGDVIVGAPGAADVLSGEGRAFAYLGSAGGLVTTAVWNVRGGQVDAGLGNSVASAGDVDGDGFGDVIVGTELFDKVLNQFFSIVDVGRAQLFRGTGSGPEAAPAWTVIGNGNQNLGHVVATAGDVNGDGYSDVIVSSVYSDGGASDEGSVSVFVGSATGLSTSAHWSFGSLQAFANLGAGAASAGDVNRDGYSDIIVGAPFFDSLSRQDNGKAWVFAGPLTGASATTPLWTFVGNNFYENAGNAVGAAGDINGDGFPDVVVGSPGYTSQNFQGEGRVTLFYGNVGGVYAAPDDAQPRRVQQLDGDAILQVSALGRTSDTHFTLGSEMAGAMGRGRVRLEWEVAPLGTLLGTGTILSDAWGDSHPGGPGSSAPRRVSPVLTLPGDVAHWRVRVANRSPYFPHSPWFTLARNGVQETDLHMGDTVSPPVAAPPFAGQGLALRVTPNPFNPRTTIAMDLPRAGRVQLQIFDLRGRHVNTLLDEPRPAGATAFVWDGRDGAGRQVASGTYFARVELEGVVQTTKLTLVR